MDLECHFDHDLLCCVCLPPPPPFLCMFNSCVATGANLGPPNLEGLVTSNFSSIMELP